MLTVAVTVVREKNLFKLFFLSGSTLYLAGLANWLPCGYSLELADKVFDVHLHVLQRVMGSQLFCFTQVRATFHLNYGHTLVTCSLHLQALCHQGLNTVPHRKKCLNFVPISRGMGWGNVWNRLH